MKILKFPDPALFQVCKEVSVFGPELKILLEAMWETMIHNKGIGLASNQTGLNLRMFAMLGPNDQKLFIVNPKVLKESLISANLKEGCLSSPGEFLVIPHRPKWVQISFQDETGKQHERVFHGIHSVCVSHEIGHLNGESYLQSPYLNRAKRKELAKKWGLK